MRKDMGIGWVFLSMLGPIGFVLLIGRLLDKVRISAIENRISTELNNKEAIRANEESQSLTSGVIRTYESSIKLAAEISEHTEQASLWLKTAEGEYSDNAFSPYWDAIEKVVRHLAAYDKKIGTLSSNAESYYQSLRGRKHTFPSFPVKPATLPNVSPILNEFRRVIRLGLTNHQFAIIWEHYKDRKVMIAGFHHLGEAVNNLGHVIEDSISHLQDSISSDLAKSVEDGIKTREVIADAGKAVDKRLLEQNQILDKRQRHGDI
jgi:hypothetical protein